MITVKYFASLQDRFGKPEDQVDADSLSLAEIWSTLHNEDIPKGILVSLNHEYANWSDIANDGDEVAFFPPVTGG